MHVYFRKYNRISVKIPRFCEFRSRMNEKSSRCLQNGGKHMRIILDTDKKTITVPWNYQKKLDALNDIIVEATGNEDNKKTFTGYIDEIWKEAIKNSDKCVKTASKPTRK